MLNQVKEALNPFSDEEETEEVETSDLTAEDVLDRMSSFNQEHRRSFRTQNQSKELTPGRKKTLRESGWDGVQGTHHQVKYRKLQKLQQRLEDAREQVQSHSGSRARTFEAHAEHLEERIARQKAKIKRAEG